LAINAGVVWNLCAASQRRKLPIKWDPEAQHFVTIEATVRQLLDFRYWNHVIQMYTPGGEEFMAHHPSIPSLRKTPPETAFAVPSESTQPIYFDTSVSGLTLPDGRYVPINPTQRVVMRPLLKARTSQDSSEGWMGRLDLDNQYSKSHPNIRYFHEPFRRRKAGQILLGLIEYDREADEVRLKPSCQEIPKRDFRLVSADAPRAVRRR